MTEEVILKEFENLRKRIMESKLVEDATAVEIGALFEISNIINRQKSTIKRQVEAIQAGYKLAEQQKAEVERLQEENKRIEGASIVFNGGVKYVKAEAYREFAERVYEFLCNRENWRTLKDQWLENGKCYWLKANLNNLVKELTEKKDKG